MVKLVYFCVEIRDKKSKQTRKVLSKYWKMSNSAKEFRENDFSGVEEWAHSVKKYQKSRWSRFLRKKIFICWESGTPSVHIWSRTMGPSSDCTLTTGPSSARTRTTGPPSAM